MGSPGSDDRLPDLSPAGYEERAELQRAALAQLARHHRKPMPTAIAAEVMAERLSASLALHEAGEQFRSMRSCKPPGIGTQIFDLMPTETKTTGRWWRPGFMPSRRRSSSTARHLREGLARGL